MTKSRWFTASLLALALGIAVFAVSCKNSSKPGGGGGAADLTIGIVGFIPNGNSYGPDSASVHVGQRVAWHNNDGITHTATSNSLGVFDTGNVGPGGTSAAIQMNTMGSFDYHCKIHGLTMKGKLVVTP